VRGRLDSHLSRADLLVESENYSRW
jgi:hypothetical protein